MFQVSIPAICKEDGWAVFQVSIPAICKEDGWAVFQVSIPAVCKEDGWAVFQVSIPDVCKEENSGDGGQPEGEDGCAGPAVAGPGNEAEKVLQEMHSTTGALQTAAGGIQAGKQF